MSKVIYNKRIAEIESLLLISPEYLKASTIIDYNITNSKLIPYILEAQELKLEPLIGTNLYDKLINPSSDYAYQYLLKNHVSRCLVNWSLAHYLEVASFSIAEGGVFKHLSTDSDVVDDREVNTMIQRSRNKAESYASRMIDFLEKYKSDYPEYTQCISDGIRASREVKHLGGLNLSPTYYPSDSQRGCNTCGGVMIDNTCNSCSYDSDLFTVNMWWGSNSEVALGFDQTTLSNQSNKLEFEIVAQPTDNYYWIVSSKDIHISQLNTDIPLDDFSNVDILESVYVKGSDNGLYWIRIKMQDTYEEQVIFNIHI